MASSSASVEPPRPAGDRIGARLRWLILAVAGVLVMVVGVVQAGRDAPTVDEGVDVSSGVSYLTEHDLRMNPEHPPLPKAIAALAALPADPIVPKTQAWEDGDWFDWSDDFISANADAGRLDAILLGARLVVLAEVLACAVLLYLLAARFFGPDGGLLAALTWLLTPYVVGIGHFAMIDIAFVLVTLGFCVVLARWRDAPTMGGALALGAVLAAGLATRHTTLALGVVAVGVMGVRLRHERRQAIEQIGLVLVVSVVGLWLVYRGLAPTGSSASVEANLRALVSSQGSDSLPTRVLGALPLPLEWQAGFAYLDLTSVPRPSSLLGQSWDGGRWWYFPVSALIKIPLPLTALVIAGWVLALRRPGRRRELATVVVLPGLVLWLFLVAQPLNLGLRLALPSVALAFVGVGALAPWALSATGARTAETGGARVRRLTGVVVPVVLVVALVDVVWSSPHSLAWTQAPFTPAYRWVSDSNLDAGQALYEVRDWATEHDRPYVALDSTRGLSVEGGSRRLSGVDPTKVRGWVAVGVTPLMQTRRDELAWLRKYCPVDELGGGSVLVYRFMDPPDPAPGPIRPAPPCFGNEFSVENVP
jgi:hypothetical protein